MERRAEEKGSDAEEEEAPGAAGTCKVRVG